jgi:glycerol-3-phosphate O-acyltransferase
MSTTELAKPYEPNPALQALFRLFFDRIKVDDAWSRTVSRLAEQGVVIYVLRSLNLLDFLALDHLTKRHALPRIHFANDLGCWVLNPSVSRGYQALVRRPSEVERLRQTIRQGGSAALFLKRPPGVRDVAAGVRRGRGLKEGEELVELLLDEQCSSSRPILLLPQVFVWTRRPDTRGTRPLDLLLGPREWPSTVRAAAQLLSNTPHVELRVGEPLNLAEFIRSSATLDDSVLIRRATYAMLRRLERERRSVTGPAHKSPERVRQELLRTPRLRAAVRDLAGERAADRVALTRQALEMLRGLQATPDHSTAHALELLFHRILHRVYAGIEYDPADIKRIREACKDHTLVLLPSHKSHIDYIVLGYIFKREGLPLPLAAAGDNLDFFPAGPVLRRAGAFFIRRSFRGDRLYAAVVDAYIRRLIRDGHPIELYLEGGRSRTGKLLTPKFGLLNMIGTAALALPHKRTCFVPVSIGYERVMEASSYERELRGGDKTKEDAAGLLATRKLLHHRYGRINLQFGQMLTLDELRAELELPPAGDLSPAQRRSLTSRLGNRVLDEINRVTAVTPGALVALVLLSHTSEGLSHEQLSERCHCLFNVLRSTQARVTPATVGPTGQLRPQAVVEAVQMFVDAQLVEATAAADQPGSRWRRRTQVSAGPGAYYGVRADKRLVLDTSKNIIVHFFVERGLVASAVRACAGGPLELGRVRSRVQSLSRLLKYEFRFRAGSSYDEIFEHTVRTMTHADELRLTADGHVQAGSGKHGWTGHQWLEIYAEILRNFLEGYQVAARALTHLVKGSMAEKELVKRALGTGTRMFEQGEIRRREAVSKSILANAFSALVDQEYLQRRQDKLELPESFRSPDAVRAIEGKIVGLWAVEQQPQ